MSEIFTASNGEPVFFNGEGVFPVHTGDCFLVDEAVQALREYFLAERDKELGRWRDPEDGDVVVYRNPEKGGAIIVKDERTGNTTPWHRGLMNQTLPSNYGNHETANRYFEAHPEKKPWHDAEPGEWWDVTVKGVTYRTLVDLQKDFTYLPGGDTYLKYFSIDDPSITVGHKL